MFSISIDEKCIKLFDTEEDAIKEFKKLKLKGNDQGYLDKVDNNGEHIFTVAHKIGRKIYCND